MTMDRPELEAASQDFSRISAALPAIVVKPECEEDVVHILRTAQAAGIPIATRGMGHSCGGQTLSPGGIVLWNVSRQPPQLALDKEGLVTVSARTTWQALETALLLHGRTSPILTDYLDLTIGGTLSVGGYGVRSILYGAQVDQVEQLRLIRPDGAALWCSAQSESALFRGALGGLGRTGVIEQVVMRTLPLRRHYRLILQVHKSLSELASSLAWMLDWPEDRSSGLCFDAFLIDGMIVSEYATEGTSPEAIPELPQPLRNHIGRPARSFAGQDYSQYVQEKRVAWLNRFPRHHALWSDFFFSYPDFCAFLTFLDEARRSGTLSPHLKAIYVLACRPSADRPRPPHLPDTAPLPFSVGMYYMAPPDLWTGAGDGPAQLCAARKLCEQRAHELQGRPYLYGRYELA